MNRSTEFGRRLLLSVDAKGYGSGDEQRQHSIQTALPAVLREAAEAARLDRSRWSRQGGGDSEFAVLPEGESEPRLVDDFVRALDAVLRAYNRDRHRHAWLRLRVAIHFGTAVQAPNGFSGQGPIVVSRLVDCEPLRQALDAAEDACLAVILSQRVFNDVVRQTYTTLRTEEFREVQVTHKEFSDRAWIRIPGYDLKGLDLGEREPPARSADCATTPGHGRISEPQGAGMLTGAMTAWAAAGGSAVVQTAGTDAWAGLRQRVARWFGRGVIQREHAELERLDQTAQELETTPAATAEQVRIRHQAVWQARIEALLESLDNSEREQAANQLQALLREQAAPAVDGISAGAGGVAAGGTITNQADRGSVAATVIHGGVHINHPPQPDPSQG